MDRNWRPTVAGLREVTAAGLGGGPLTGVVPGYRRGTRGLVHGNPTCRRIPARDRWALPVIDVDLTALASGELPDPCDECFADLLEAQPGASGQLRAAAEVLAVRRGAEALPADCAGDPVESFTAAGALRDLAQRAARLSPTGDLAGVAERLAAELAARADRLVADTLAVTDPDGAAHAAAVHVVAAHAAWQANHRNLIPDPAAERYRTVLGDVRDVGSSLTRSAVDAWRHALGAAGGAADRLDAAAEAAREALLAERGCARVEDVDVRLLALIRPTLPAGDFPTVAAWAHAELVAAQRAWAAELVAGWAALYLRAREAARTGAPVVACWPVPERDGRAQRALAGLWGHRVPEDRLPDHYRPDPMHVAVLPLTAALTAVAGPPRTGSDRRRAAILGAARDGDTDDVLDLAVQLHLEQVEGAPADVLEEPWAAREALADPVPELAVTDRAALVAARGVLFPAAG